MDPKAFQELQERRRTQIAELDQKVERKRKSKDREDRIQKHQEDPLKNPTLKDIYDLVRDMADRQTEMYAMLDK